MKKNINEPIYHTNQQIDLKLDDEYDKNPG